jgi:hypothetical protein
MEEASEACFSTSCVFFLCVKNQVKAPKPARPMTPKPIPMPAFAPSLKPPPFATIPDVCDVEGEDEGVVKVVMDVELGDAAMVEGAEPTTKVANSADGAGATKVSAVGMSQRIETPV